MGMILTLAVLMGLSSLSKKRDRAIGPELPHHFAFWIFIKKFATKHFKNGLSVSRKSTKKCIAKESRDKLLHSFLH